MSDHPPKRGRFYKRPKVHAGFLKAWRANGLDRRVMNRVKAIFKTPGSALLSLLALIQKCSSHDCRNEAKYIVGLSSADPYLTVQGVGPLNWGDFNVPKRQQGAIGVLKSHFVCRCGSGRHANHACWTLPWRYSFVLRHLRICLQENTNKGCFPNQYTRKLAPASGNLHTCQTLCLHVEMSCFLCRLWT